MNTSSPNLLEEALTGGDIVAGPKRRGRVVVIEDCVETSGGFLLHHFIKRALSPHSDDVVVFLAFAQPFSHYDRILRKMVGPSPFTLFNAQFDSCSLLNDSC